MESSPISVANICEWCGDAATFRCGACNAVYYCSRDHLLKHWDTHSKMCKKFLPLGMQPSSNMGQSMPSSNMNQNMPSNMSHNVPLTNINPVMNVPVTFNLPFSSSVYWNQNNVSTPINEHINRLPVCGNIIGPNSYIPPEKSIDFNVCANEILSSLSEDNSFWNLIDTSGAQNMLDFDFYLGKDTINQMPMPLNIPAPVNLPTPLNLPAAAPQNLPMPQTLSIPQNPPVSQTSPVPQNLSSAYSISNATSHSLINDDDINLIECAPLSDICETVIHDLNTYGICVLDKFIGSKRGNLVLNEVKTLYNSGIFEKGKLVRTSAYIASEKIRSDVTTWVDGTEPYCQNIRYLMDKLDLIIAYCNKMPDNGQLSNYKLHKRTKAMVACYPGNGTHYQRHIDNPNKDGRCITCIYYLNRNWDVKKHGGMLRMYPCARDSDVAQIDPIFDRMIFFWSDRRNPHEVLPAHAMRFAITVWYFDADERDAALKKQQEKNEHSQSSSVG